MWNTQQFVLALAGILIVQAASVADGGKQQDGDATRVQINTKVGKLIKQLDSPPDCMDAMVALGDLGLQAAPAAPRLGVFLRNENWTYRLQAVVALHEIGAGAVGQVPALVRALGDEQAEVSAGASITLENMGGLAVPGLVGGLNHPQSQVRRKAADTLRRIGKAAQGALPALQRAATDNDAGVSNSARRAIKNIQGQPPS